MSEPTAHQRLTRAGHSAQFADLVLEQRDRELADQQRRTHDEDRRPHGAAMTSLSHADELRAAAVKLRTARFTAAMTATPAVAALLRAREPLAKWLEGIETEAKRRSRILGDSPDHCINPDALTVARAINGGEQP